MYILANTFHLLSQISWLQCRKIWRKNWRQPPSLPSRSVPEPIQESTADINEKIGRRRKQFGPLLNSLLTMKMWLNRNKKSDEWTFSSLLQKYSKYLAENLSSGHILIGSFWGMRPKIWLFGNTDPLPRRSVPQTPSTIIPPETAQNIQPLLKRLNSKQHVRVIYIQLSSTQKWIVGLCQYSSIDLRFQKVWFPTSFFENIFGFWGLLYQGDSGSVRRNQMNILIYTP